MQERHRTTLEMIRTKHRQQMELKEDQIAQLTRQAGDATDKVEKSKREYESAFQELQKLQKTLLKFKDETNSRYQSYNQECNHQHQESEAKILKKEREVNQTKDQLDQL